MKRLILVDALALLYRSFYAIRELSTEAGRPTNAVYGFIRKLRAILKTYAPTHWGVAFDGGIPERRLELLPDYKAQRPSMPHALREQLPAVEAYLDAAGIARIRIEGQEADDIIASVAAWAEPQADAIYVASSDKDLFQLVSDKTMLLTLTGPGELMDRAAVRAKTGVEPEQIIDWLAMVGDNVDNIPGIAGVGPKTAAGLLTQYKSLDTIQQHLADIPSAKLRQALADGGELLTRNVDLIRLDPGIEVKWGWSDLEVREPDEKKLLVLFEELEFRNLAREIREPELF